MSNIGYYPIKENEIKEVIKMIYLYHKKDFDNLDEIMNNYNVNDSKKKSIYESFEKCLLNKDSKYFDVFYGVCIAEVQKIFRGHFNLEDKSITQFIIKYPVFNKYTKKLDEFIKFKNNKYEFVNYLKFPQSSGVYIPYEKIKEIYNDYYSDNQIRKFIDTYYDEYSDKFLDILDYCLKNKCGLLEAQLKEVNKKFEQNEVNKNNVNKDITNKNYSSKNIANKDKQHAKETKKIATTKEITKLLIGYFLLLTKALGVVVSVVGSVLGSVFSLSTVLITLFADSAISTIIDITICIISIIVQIFIVFFAWKQSTKLAFKKKTINYNDVPVVMKNLTLLSILICIISAIWQYAIYGVKIESKLNSSSELEFRNEIVEPYYNDEQKEEYYSKREEFIKEIKKQGYKNLIIRQSGILIVYLAVLPYEKKRILENLEQKE